MQCKNTNEDLVSGFLISVVAFEQGTKLYMWAGKGSKSYNSKRDLKKKKKKQP